MTTTTTITIIGKGRVGGALHERSSARGVSTVLLGRDGPWEALVTGEGPIVVATRNDDLDDVLGRVPETRRGDLVFVQNGMLRPWLERAGLAACTRGLLFFAVSKRGDPISPGGTSPFWGPRAADMVTWFRALDLDASDVDAATFAAQELEKLLWNCVFGLLCEVHDAPVGKLLAEHRDEVARLTAELAQLGAAALGIEVEVEPLVDRLCAYSASIPDYQGAVKEFEWRNGWFVQLDPTAPLHAELLNRVGRRPES